MDLLINDFKKKTVELSNSSGLPLLVLHYVFKELSEFCEKQAQYQIELNGILAQDKQETSEPVESETKSEEVT